MADYKLLLGDALTQLKTLPDESIQCVITSPPYWALRDYGVDGQLGLELTLDEWLANMVSVFSEVHRILRKDGTLWVNMGDSYATQGHEKSKDEKGKHLTGGGMRSWGEDRQRNKKIVGVSGLKPKDLVGQPWELALALRRSGWYLRSDVIWYKPNPMPESCSDRPTKSHEYLFLLSKNQHYFYDAHAIKEKSIYAGDTVVNNMGKNSEMGKYGRTRNGFLGEVLVKPFRNKRTVWEIPTQPCPEAHFATFPEKLIEPCILAGSRWGDTILDTFSGSGTTGVVALKHGRKYIGIELNPAYMKIAEKRLAVIKKHHAVMKPLFR